MHKYPTTVNFIHICRDEKEQVRLNVLAKNIGFQLKTLRPYRKDILRICDFVKEIDEKLHSLVADDTENEIFLGQTLHGHIASDLRSLIILGLSGQNYQLNIVLRHFIEVFVMTLWADIGSGFRGSYNYFLETEEWKPYRSRQRLTWDLDRNFPNRSIKERLERIRLLNMIEGEGKEVYKKILLLCILM